MEILRGRASLDLDGIELKQRIANFNRLFLDLGTGDGRYVHCLAERNPEHFFIGVDSCRENLLERSRSKNANMLFVIANAQRLPPELSGLISHVTINFPWGSLLKSLLTGDSCLLYGIEQVSKPDASLTIRLNGGALAEAGVDFEDGAMQIYNNLLCAGWRLNNPVTMNSEHLQNFPSTWAKRLAFGRDPRALELNCYL